MEQVAGKCEAMIHDINTLRAAASTAPPVSEVGNKPTIVVSNKGKVALTLTQTVNQINDIYKAKVKDDKAH